MTTKERNNADSIPGAAINVLVIILVFLVFNSHCPKMASSNIINTLTSILEREEGPLVPKDKILSILRKKQLDEDENLPNQPDLPDEGDADLINRNNKVLWSIKEMTITFQDDDTDDNTDAADGTDRPKKKKSRKDHLLSKKNRNDPNAPALNRIPLPELRDSEKLDKQQAIRDVSKRLKLGPDTLPSVCFYTLLNGHHHHNSAALCAEISEDSKIMAAGFSDSSIRVWSLTEEKLKGMRNASDLETLDKESDDVTTRMMDTTSTDVKVLRGHNGPVYNVAFSPDRTLLLSCSEDSTGMCLLQVLIFMLNFFCLQFVYGAFRHGRIYVVTRATFILFGM